MFTFGQLRISLFQNKYIRRGNTLDINTTLSIHMLLNLRISSFWEIKLSKMAAWTQE